MVIYKIILYQKIVPKKQKLFMPIYYNATCQCLENSCLNWVYWDSPDWRRT